GAPGVEGLDHLQEIGLRWPVEQGPRGLIVGVQRALDVALVDPRADATDGHGPALLLAARRAAVAVVRGRSRAGPGAPLQAPALGLLLAVGPIAAPLPLAAELPPPGPDREQVPALAIDQPGPEQDDRRHGAPERPREVAHLRDHDPALDRPPEHQPEELF